MNYQALHQNSLAERRAKKQAPRERARLGLESLGQVANANVRESAFRHFSNVLQSFRTAANLDEGQIRRRRKEIANIAKKWTFELPEWF